MNFGFVYDLLDGVGQNDAERRYVSSGMAHILLALSVMGDGDGCNIVSFTVDRLAADCARTPSDVVAILRKCEDLGLIDKGGPCDHRSRSEYPSGTVHYDRSFWPYPRDPARHDRTSTWEYRNKQRMFDEQGGVCNGCRGAFVLDELQIDHIVSKKRQGTNGKANLQLLCGPCNRLKGPHSHEWLLEELERRKAVAP